MTHETIEQPSEILTDRCARLVPGYWGYETSLIISDAEPHGEGFTPLVDTETAQQFAVSLAKCVLTGNAQFGAVDPASPQGQELAALISELSPPEQAPAIESEQAETEVGEKSMMALLFELHRQSVEDRARALLELASLDGQERTLDEGFITDKTVAFLPVNEAAIEKEQEESGIEPEELFNTGTILYAQLMVAQRTNIDIILRDKSGAALRIYLLNPDETERRVEEREVIKDLRKERQDSEPETPSPDSLLSTYIGVYQEDLANRAGDLILAVQSNDQQSAGYFQRRVRMSAMAEAARDVEREESGLSRTDVTNRAAATYCLCAALQREDVDIIFRDPDGTVALLEPVWGPTEESR